MNIPGYDEWKLAAPDDDQPDEPDLIECEACDGTGRQSDADGYFECPECEGTGEVAPPEPDEPDGDYAYERARDRRASE